MIQNFAQKPVNITETSILLETVDITAPITTKAFDLNGCKVWELFVLTGENGGEGTIAYQVNYSSSDSVDGGGLLENAVALPNVYYLNSKGYRGEKEPGIDFENNVLKTAIFFDKPNLGVGGVPTEMPNTKFNLTLTPAALTGVNKVTVVLVKHNAI